MIAKNGDIKNSFDSKISGHPAFDTATVGYFSEPKSGSIKVSVSDEYGNSLPHLHISGAKGELPNCCIKLNSAEYFDRVIYSDYLSNKQISLLIEFFNSPSNQPTMSFNGISYKLKTNWDYAIIRWNLENQLHSKVWIDIKKDKDGYIVTPPMPNYTELQNTKNYSDGELIHTLEMAAIGQFTQDADNTDVSTDFKVFVTNDGSPQAYIHIIENGKTKKRVCVDFSAYPKYFKRDGYKDTFSDKELKAFNNFLSSPYKYPQTFKIKNVKFDVKTYWHYCVYQWKSENDGMTDNIPLSVDGNGYAIFPKQPRTIQTA